MTRPTLTAPPGDDGCPHDDILMRPDQPHPIGPECPGARAACGWTFADYMLAALLGVAAACMFRLAHLAHLDPTPRTVESIGWTAGVGVAAVVVMFGLGWWRGRQ